MRYLFFIAIFCGFSFGASAQVEMNGTKTTAVVKGSYIYNFGKNCKWHETFYESDVFKIAVYGDKDLHDELLDKYSTRPLNSQIVEVVWVTDIHLLYDEQIVFVSYSKKDEIQELAQICKENKSMLISDFKGGLENGAIANFVIVDNTITFDLNMAQAEKNFIQLGTKMLDWVNNTMEK